MTDLVADPVFPDGDNLIVITVIGNLILLNHPALLYLLLALLYPCVNTELALNLLARPEFMLKPADRPLFFSKPGRCQSLFRK